MILKIVRLFLSWPVIVTREWLWHRGSLCAGQALRMDEIARRIAGPMYVHGAEKRLWMRAHPGERFDRWKCIQQQRLDAMIRRAEKARDKWRRP